MGTFHTCKCRVSLRNRQACAHEHTILKTANRSGFFIIEVMVALLLLAITSLIVAWYQGHAALAYRQAREEVVAVMYAREVMNMVRNEKKIASSGAVDRGDYHCSWYLKRARIPKGLVEHYPHLKYAVDCFECTMSVGWLSGDGTDRSVALFSLIAPNQRVEKKVI